MSTPVILVISREPRHSKLVDIFLSNEGYVVISAEDSGSVNEALTVVSPDMILLDVHFSDAEPVHLVQRLKNDPTLCSIPRIGLSMYKEHWDEQKAQEAGYHGLVTLPFDARQVLSYIDTFLTDHEANK